MIRTQLARPGGRGSVRIRRAGKADIPALRCFFDGLSSQTRYLRFFGPLRPTGAMLRRLSGDGAHALIAIAGDAVIGHAMACDQPPGHGPAEADIGVVVADAWQGRGVGAALVRDLVTAAAGRGVTVLAMDVLPGNRKVLDMIAGHWQVLSTGYAEDSVAVRARVPRPDSERPLAGLPGQAGPGGPGPGGPGLRLPVPAGRVSP